MKKNWLNWTLVVSMMLAPAFVACDDDDDDDDNKEIVPGEEEKPSDEHNYSTDGGLVACDNLLFDGNVIGNGDQEFVFKGTQTLAKGTYLLKGWVYVADGSTLTIEPGTIIKGDKQTKAALIVERGGKLIAQGSATQPIVFTSEEAAGSRKPGDWGGLILCGKAKNNQGEMQIEGGPRTKHGGENDADNSGVVSYVRIEFAGYPFATDKEINGLTLGSVGSATKIDHVQVSYCNDDSYEWFGGSVNCDHLVAFRGWDDEFDTDNGFSGKVQFCLSVRDPRLADTSRSNGFESDNCADGSAVSPYTTVTFSNVTFVGPVGQDANFVNDETYINGGSVYPNNGSSLGKFQAAMHIRRSSRLSCFNSVAMGWPIGLILDNEKGNTQGAASDKTLKLENLWFAGMTLLGADCNKADKDALYDYTAKTYDETKNSFSHDFFLAQTGNKSCEVSELGMAEADAKVGVAIMPAAGSAMLSAASFTDALLSEGFEKVSYIGAFAAGDTWLDGWTEFDPQNAKY